MTFGTTLIFFLSKSTILYCLSSSATLFCNYPVKNMTFRGRKNMTMSKIAKNYKCFEEVSLYQLGIISKIFDSYLWTTV